MQFKVKLLVVACNTASAVALPLLQQALRPLPVVGVVEPGAAAAVASVPGGRHLVLATEATVSLGAYSRALRNIDPEAVVDELACEMLVALAEEGWTDGAVPELVVRRYLDPWPSVRAPDSIILGCTHFPLLRRVIATVAGPGIAIVDSASTTASFVAQWLASSGCASTRAGGSVRLLATDGARRFARVGGAFLGQTLVAEDIELVDL